MELEITKVRFGGKKLEGLSRLPVGAVPGKIAQEGKAARVTFP